MKNVVVTNKNTEAYSRKFDGKLYSFPTDEPVIVPEGAAGYLFGYGLGEADRARILIRNGWQKNGVSGDPFGPDTAMKRLQNFVFKSAPDDAPRLKPEKKIAPGTAEIKKNREMTGVNAVSPDLIATGGMVHNKGGPATIHLPNKGAKAPLLQPAV